MDNLNSECLKSIFDGYRGDELVDDLLDLYNRYFSGEYDIGDVSRMLSYIAIPNLDHEYIRQVESQIEWIRFMSEEKEQKEKCLLC